MINIRRANKDDAKDLHEAHMQSIKTICKNDYSIEQITAWGGRVFNEEEAHLKIEKDFVWAVEFDHSIEGYVHFKIIDKNQDKFGYVTAFYFTPKLKGKGAGKIAMNAIIDTAKSLKLSRIELSSTITSLNFYKKFNFIETNQKEDTLINGVLIPSIPMVLKF